jgi:hypothetical protein
MDRIPLDLIPQDFRRGRRGNPYACLLERTAERQHGAKLKVGGSHARERGRLFPRTWSLDADAQQIVGLFDAGAGQRDIFRGRNTVRVYLHGEPFARRQRQDRGMPRSRPVARRLNVPRRHRRSLAAVGVIGSMALIGDGLAWIVITAVGVVVAAAAGIRVRRRQRARYAAMPAYPARPAVPEPWRSGWPEQTAAPAPMPWPAEPEQVRQPEPPPWPERVPAPVPPAAEPDPLRWPGTAPVPDEVTEPAAARSQVPEPAWPDAPAIDPDWYAREAEPEPVRSR